MLSLHVDRHASAAASGVATYYYGSDESATTPRSASSSPTWCSARSCARTDLVDCRMHAKTWDLLRRTRMPAVRLEVGYLTNPGDAARLADPAFRDVLAEAVVAAVQRLYLPEDADAQTGVLRIPEWLRACARTLSCRSCNGRRCSS